MLKIKHITPENPYFLECTFSNGITKRVNVLPLIKNHLHLKGVEKLLDPVVFQQAKIGFCGEIVWRDIVEITHNDTTVLWDYDISPEFAFEKSV